MLAVQLKVQLEHTFLQTRSQTEEFQQDLERMIDSKTPSPPSYDHSADILIQSFKERWRTLAQTLSRAVHTDTILPPQPDDISVPNYIGSVKEARKQSKLTRQKRCHGDELTREQARKHTDTMKSLMDLLQYSELFDTEVQEVISQLLSLAYFILRFCYKRAQQEKDPTNSRLSYRQLREFLSDMVITFLLLKSVTCVSHYEAGFCSLSHDSLPEIEKVKIHLNISPTNPVFQELVLWGILEVLYDDRLLQTLRTVKPTEDTQAERVKCLAQLVHNYFSPSRRRLKTPDTLCCIICNQSCYMATGSPLLKKYIEDNIEVKIMKKLHKNFVSERTAHAVFEKATRVICIRRVVSDFNDRGMDTAAFVMSCNKHSITTKCNKDCEIIKYPIKLKSFEKDLNTLHHAILVDAVNSLHEFLELPPLSLDKNCWFKDTSSNLEETLKDLVKRLIERYKQNLQNQNIRRLMSNLAISFQYIIYTRWLLCETKDQPGIGMNRDSVKHQKTVFLFLALRTLIMYLLPVRDYGELSSDSTKKLAQYASRLRFKLHIHCPYV